MTSPLGSDFTSLLDTVRPAIEARLGQLWDERLAALRRHPAEVTTMAAAAQELTLRGGKRFRAALLAAAYAGVAPEAPLEPAYQAGVALELLQTYLLVQDDWMDGDLTRRGGPSVHASLAGSLGNAHLGASSAMLASDLTCNLAVAVVAGIDLPAPRVLATLRLLTRIHEDVILGQQIDMMGRAEDVEAMHALKTGSYTVRGPLVLGATLAGAPAETIAALERYAAPVGVAFQLRDDLLGTFGSSEQTGKPVGNDLRTGKRTAILAEAEPRLNAAERAALDRAFGNLSAGEADIAAATAALISSGAMEAVRDRLKCLCREAEALALALPLADPAPELLRGAAAALAPGGGLRESTRPGPES
jgi:geranylgeranyl diphosphate synthase type I